MVHDGRASYQADVERALRLMSQARNVRWQGTVWEADEDFPEREFVGRAWDGQVEIDVPIERPDDAEFLRASHRISGALSDAVVSSLLLQGLLKGTVESRADDAYSGEAEILYLSPSTVTVRKTFALRLRDGDFSPLHRPLAPGPWKTEGGQRLVLIGCVEKKAAEPRPAKDLYLSPLFAFRRQYAERSGRPWAIVSASHHNIIDPERVISPYDRTMGDLTRDERRQWILDVGWAFFRRFGELARGAVVEVHAGEAYVEALTEALVDRFGVTIETPMAGMAIGQQLQAYKRGLAAPPGAPLAAPPGAPLAAPRVHPKQAFLFV